MRQRRLLRFHGLKRPRVRQTWNKYNLFNLMRQRTPLLQPKTFFQQKWIAKSLTRGYHGEHIKEYQWERMFSRRPLSAVDMDPAYMARHDGSEQAAGRGSGLLPPPRAKGAKRDDESDRHRATPYMQMVFAPMERRLDIAIFRALFASSARQARQFVLHGAVTVNGKKMRHPGYLLNPGDMFQVNVERVMTATGQQKRPNKNQKALPTTATESTEAEEGDVEEVAAAEAETPEEPIDAEAAKEKHLATLNNLKSRVQKILGKTSEEYSAKRKQALRKLLKDVKAAMDTARKPTDTTSTSMSEVEQELTSLFSELSITPAERKSEAKQTAIEEKNNQPQQEGAGGGLLTAEERAILQRLAREEARNPHDPSKPYKTPWQPREWMSPFAFIPRYLEVNQRICAAVYLRHPVARPGLCEVPTPFSPTLSQLAFNWYLRRR